MTAADAGMLVGALVPTFLLSRLFLWLTKSWQGGFSRLALVHLLSAAIASTVSAMGHADGGPLDWSFTYIYLSAQAIWLVVDLLAARRRQSVER